MSNLIQFTDRVKTEYGWLVNVTLDRDLAEALRGSWRVAGSTLTAKDIQEMQRLEDDYTAEVVAEMLRVHQKLHSLLRRTLNLLESADAHYGLTGSESDELNAIMEAMDD